MENPFSITTKLQLFKTPFCFTKSIAVCKCLAHTNNTDSVSLGNAKAAAAAKTAATQPTTFNPLFVSTPVSVPQFPYSNTVCCHTTRKDIMATLWCNL